MSTDAPPGPSTPKSRLNAAAVVTESLAILGTGFAGAWLASLFNYLFDRQLFPDRLRDGQYAFTFLFSVPSGWVLGTSLYALYQGAYKRCDHKRELTAGLWIANAALLLLCLPLVPIVAITLGLTIEALGLNR